MAPVASPPGLTSPATAFPSLRIHDTVHPAAAMWGWKPALQWKLFDSPASLPRLGGEVSPHSQHEPTHQVFLLDTLPSLLQRSPSSGTARHL